jgi:NADH-quinone oxidoreductase subunit A
VYINSDGHCGRALRAYNPAMSVTLAAETFSHYGPIGVLLLIAVAFAAGNLVITHLIGPSRQGSVKGMVYESGMNPFGDARRRFNVRFYVVAMTFLLFDVEIVFLYPWALVFGSLGEDSGLSSLFLGRVLFFILTSVIAFMYAWRKGVFRYD